MEKLLAHGQPFSGLTHKAPEEKDTCAPNLTLNSTISDFAREALRKFEFDLSHGIILELEVTLCND